MPEADFPSVVLNDGATLPSLGLGTYALNGASGQRSVASALGLGYRLLDSAVNYQNEAEVGRAVAEIAPGGEAAIVTTKVPGRDHGYEETLRSYEASLERLGRIDLYLIHWPNPNRGRYVDSWRAMVEIQKQGRVRSIGVSNFNAQHLREVADVTGVMPAVNQVELHPAFPQIELRAVHAELGVRTESWSPLGEGKAFNERAVTASAAKYEKTPAQVVLRWHVHLGSVALPKAASAERQRENADIFDFELTEAEVEDITALGRHDGRLWGGDPLTNEEM